MPESANPPALTLTVEEHGNCVVIHCNGRLVIATTDLLYKPVSALVPTHKRIILDLKDLTHMDSMGLGTLLRLYLGAKTRGCTIELRNLGDRIRQLMIMTNLLPVFTVIGEQGVRM